MTITPKEFLDAELSDMNLTMDNPDFVALAQSVADLLSESDIKSLTWIDFGAGTGVYSEVMRRNGFDIVAQDIWKEHRDYCKENYPDLKVIARPVKADAMLFIEVAEHMTDDEIYKAIEKIDPDVILFSSTPEKTDLDEQWGHVNIKQVDEWIAFWQELGYKANRVDTPTTWSMLLEKGI